MTISLLKQYYNYFITMNLVNIPVVTLLLSCTCLLSIKETNVVIDLLLIFSKEPIYV